MSMHVVFTIAALSAFLLAATVGISSARGVVLILIGALLSWAPDWMAGLEWAVAVGFLYGLVLRVCAPSCIRNPEPGQLKHETEMISSMVPSERDDPIPDRKWIGDVSLERVGRVWRAEDHEALVRAIRATDELAEALVASTRRNAEDAASGKSSLGGFPWSPNND